MDVDVREMESQVKMTVALPAPYLLVGRKGYRYSCRPKQTGHTPTILTRVLHGWLGLPVSIVERVARKRGRGLTLP